MKIVLDTNVLISGVINPDGKPVKIVNLLLNEKVKLLYDNRIIREYSEVLCRKKFSFTPNMIVPLIDFIKMEGEFVAANPVNAEMEDESDKKFLEAAMSGKAEYLITGNKKHFPKSKFIVTPAEFLEIFV
ncbi:MAG: putative toxin-antitoxin system toxin component, PIN family [Spirochaetes bacterium]|nr:putative toxin-antitoxin system toxin component, PIN family [Spirochaetota bacterium]